MKDSGSRFARHGERHAIDSPAVESLLGSIVFREGHLESLVRRGSGRSRFCKARITPLERGWSRPLCLTAAACVLHDDSHAVPTVAIIQIAQDPDAWMIHLHYRRDALRGANP